MKDLVRQVQAVSGKFQNKITNLINPLASIFGVNAHAYYRIDSQGGLTHLCNLPEISEYYFSNELYKNNPFLKHPDLIQPGFMLASAVENPQFQQAQTRMEQKYQLFNLLLIFEREGDVLHAHGFATTRQDFSLTNVYLNNMERFRCYCDYFRKETASFQKTLDTMKVDFGSHVGAQFYKNERPIDPRMKRSKQAEFFHWMNKSHEGLDMDMPLSDREIECLMLLLEGKPASLIAEQMSITTRTVEHHIDHIKNKLTCSTKSELFSFVNTLKKCGGDLFLLGEPWE